MSREIKFRAWLKKEKKMVEPLSIDLEKQQILFNEPSDKHWTEIRIVSFDDIELLQYTGLKDKNGVEICDGDIVNICGFSNREVVEYEASYYFGFVLTGYDAEGRIISRTSLLKYSSTDFPKLEVIGNIYKNKELLEND